MNKLVLAIAVLAFLPALINAQIDTNTVVYSWKLDEYYSSRIRVDVDTALDNFQNQNSVFSNYISVSTPGNYGAPLQSNVFTERGLNDEFLFINPFYPFMQQFTGTRYFNTRKPFTRISYFRGGSSQNKEEILDAFHSQNLTKTLNVGLRYITVGSMGQYRFQRVKNNSFNFFSSLNGSLYSYHLSFNFNKIVADENGGILNDSLITDTTFSITKDIPTLFGGTDNPPRHEPDVYTEVRNLNLFAVQEIAFRGKRSGPDSAVTTKKFHLFYPKLIYIFRLNRNTRLFNDKDPAVGLNNGLYPAILYNNELTGDSLKHWQLINSARLQFQGRKSNRYFVDYNYEMSEYSVGIPSGGLLDTLVVPGISGPKRLDNSFISSGFNTIFVNHIELGLFGRYYLTGYRSTDFKVSGELRLFTGKPGRQSSLIFKAQNELRSPDFLHTRYVSNNFVWTNNFSQTTINTLSINLTVSSKKFDIQGDYVLLHNFIYFNEQAVPEQFHRGLSILSIWASKRFDFWKITSNSKVVYQKTDNHNIIGLPAFAFSNSSYVKLPVNFRATEGKLLLMLGFDMFYNSSYFADAYMPSLTTFYRQTEKQLGNYPYFDAFLNVQLKRLRFFLKYEHVNTGWPKSKNYFSIPHYPRNERNLKFGLSWTFYD